MPSILRPSSRILTPELFNEQNVAWLFDDVSSQYLAREEAVVNSYPWTMACWALFDTGAANNTIMYIGDVSVTNQTWYMGQAGVFNKLFLFTRAGGIESTAQSASAFSLNTWVHCCAVAASATSRTIFLDGDQGGTDATDKTPTGLDRTAIGAIADDTSIRSIHSGRIFLPSIWNNAISTEEVFQLAQGAYPWEIRPSALRSCWMGQHGRDIIGHYHMSLYNGVSFGPQQTKVKKLWFPTRGMAPAVDIHIPRNPAIIYQVPAIV